MSKASAWAEAVGYVANICLSMHKLQQHNLQEQQLLKKVQQHCRVRWDEQGGWKLPGMQLLQHQGTCMGL